MSNNNNNNKKHKYIENDIITTSPSTEVLGKKKPLNDFKKLNVKLKIKLINTNDNTNNYNSNR